MKIKKISFLGWKNCIELTNGDFRLVVTTQIGPRIVGAFLGKSQNLLYVEPEFQGTANQPEWVNFGGHRLWHAPEDKIRSYCPDNTPVIFERIPDEDGVMFIAETEPATGIQKSLNIFAEGENSFRVEHVLCNNGLWSIDTAAWGITQLAPGGVAVLPLNREEDGLTANKTIAFWPYSNPGDKRFVYGSKLIMVKQTADSTPTKIGTNSHDGWCAYVNNGIVFVKIYGYAEDEEYPDLGCSCEVYTCDKFLELETLGKMEYLEPGDETTHTEYWSAAKAFIDKHLETEEDAIEALGLNHDDCCDDDCCCDDDDCDCGHDHHHHHHHHDDCCDDDCGCDCDEEEPTPAPKKRKAPKAAARKTAAKKSAKKKTASEE